MTTTEQLARRPGSRWLGIQLARGIAAVLVVLYHAGRSIALPQYVGHLPFGGVFGFGHAGVDFFFVLSGFIIFSVHRGDLGRPARLGHYIRRRLTRIYPIYWAVMVLVLLLAVSRPDGANIPTGWHLLASLLLLPQRQEPLLGPAWTLVFEMMFYSLFALAIVSRRLGSVLLAAWLGAIIAGRFSPGGSPLLVTLMAPINLEFMLGGAVAWLITRWQVPAPLAVAAAAAGLFLATGLAENAGLLAVAGGAASLLFATASAAAIAGLATAERQGHLRVGRAGAFIGDASYALYLIHLVAIGLAARVLGLIGLVKTLPEVAVFAIVVAAALTAGAVLHVAIERPMLRWLGRARGAALPP